MAGKAHKAGDRVKKERWKTGAIIVLVFFAVYLAILLIQVQIAEGGEVSVFVWENFPRAMREPGIELTDGQTDREIFDLFEPPYYVVTRSDGMRDLFRSQTEIYRDLKPQICAMLTQLYRGEAEPVTVSVLEDKEKWFDSLQAASVYTKLSCPVETEILEQTFSAKGGISESLTRYREMSVRSEAGKIVFYFLDEPTDQVIVFRTAIDGAELESRIESEVQMVAKNYVFAFETDKSAGDASNPTDTVSLSVDAQMWDTMLIPSVTISTPTLRAKTSDAVNGEDFYRKVFELFGYHSSETRQYTDANGVQVFVNEYSTLKIRTDGFVEYKTNGAKYGLPLTSGQNLSPGALRYQSVLGVTQTMLRLAEIAGLDTESDEWDLVLQDLTGGESAEDAVTVQLDYRFDGYRIAFENADGTEQPAVLAVVSEGKLTQMSCYLKKFEAVTEDAYFSSEWELTPNESLFNAMERSRPAGGSLQVQDAYLYYPVSEENPQVHTVWKIVTQ